MRSKREQTLAQIVSDPVRYDIVWRDIESMLNALGAAVIEGAGSRVRIALKGMRAVFHRPHPKSTTDRGAVKSMCRFLIEAGVVP